MLTITLFDDENNRMQRKWSLTKWYLPYKALPSKEWYNSWNDWVFVGFGVPVDIHNFEWVTNPTPGYTMYTNFLDCSQNTQPSLWVDGSVGD
jgi:hypothetical protein